MKWDPLNIKRALTEYSKLSPAGDRLTHSITSYTGIVSRVAACQII